jgi:hypothetical protein
MYLVAQNSNGWVACFAPRPTALPAVHRLWIKLWISL